MTIRVHGGVFNDQVLTGDLRHFRILGADFSGAVSDGTVILADVSYGIDSNSTPIPHVVNEGIAVPGSAAEIIYVILSTRATVAIMNPSTSGLHFALDYATGWIDAMDIQTVINALGNNVGVDQVDLALVTVVELQYLLGINGTDGADGADGVDGTDGNTVLSGLVAPNILDGVDGDFYINTTNETIYGPKTGGFWGPATSLIGSPGANGTNGTNGIGVPPFGLTGQVLAKIDGTSYNTTWITGAGTGSVTSVAVTTANGVSGTVLNPTTTPAITLTLGAITPSSVAATGTMSGTNLSGTNTGDELFKTIGNVIAPTVTFTDSISLTGLKMVKWVVTIENTVAGKMRGFEVFAINKSGAVTHSIGFGTGDNMNSSYTLTVTASLGDMVLSIINDEGVNSLIISTLRYKL